MSLKWLEKQSLESNENLFYHCNNCDGMECKHKNCSKGVKFLDHFNECKFKDKNCDICYSVFQVLLYHCKKCSKRDCDYPYCKFIKKRYNKIIKKEINFQIDSQIDMLKKEIEIQKSFYTELDTSLDKIKQNVKDIINLYYPKNDIKVI